MVPKVVLLILLQKMNMNAWIISKLCYRTFHKIILKNLHIVSSDDDPNRLDHNLISIVHEDSLKPYDMKEIIHSIVDNHNFFEVHELFAQNIIVGFARMNGKTIGIVASQPLFLAGALDIDSSNKASRFIRFL